MTWCQGILLDLHCAGLRWRLPLVIAQFLRSVLPGQSKRWPLGCTYSAKWSTAGQRSVGDYIYAEDQRTSIASIIPQSSWWLSALYGNDLQVCYRHPDLQNSHMNLQKYIDSINVWMKNNGFKLSPTKINTIHFTITDYVLATSWSSKWTTDKFFMFSWDPKLNWIIHVN